jgi:hypothetical protein
VNRFVFDLGNTAQWVLAAGLVAWIAQYTVYAPWWTNPIGRSIVWLAVSLEVVLGPSLFALADPSSHFIASMGYDYLETANVTFAAFVILGRIWQFYLEHRKGAMAGHGGAKDTPRRAADSTP